MKTIRFKLTDKDINKYRIYLTLHDFETGNADEIKLLFKKEEELKLYNEGINLPLDTEFELKMVEK